MSAQLPEPTRSVVGGLDERARAFVERCLAARDGRPGPQVGDFVQFSEGPLRRVSFVWHENQGGGVQTSDGGSYHLCESGACSFSGSLYRSVAAATLTATGEQRQGSAWIFHHGWPQAGNGVEFRAPFALYSCSAPAPTS